uniref:Uncharacterized protein n=1 Tax=Ditylenchus dipsaci TaxID=166011 RepID=A0A915CRK0_9BILA
MSSTTSKEQHGEHEDSVEKILEKSLLEIQVRMAQEIRSQLVLGREKIMKRLSKTRDKFATAFRIMDRQDQNIGEAFGTLETISSRLDLAVRDQKQMNKDVYAMERKSRSGYTGPPKDCSPVDFSNKDDHPKYRNCDESSFRNQPTATASPVNHTEQDRRLGDQTSGWTQRGVGVFTSEDSDSDESDLE